MSSSISVAACEPSTFADVSLYGGSVLNVEANLVTGYNAVVPDIMRIVAPSVELVDAEFCNVTIEYTHPGQDDNVFVETWLPTEEWNGRFQAIGGGGFLAGRFEFAYGMMAGALADGFAVTTTDAGVGSVEDLSLWALLSPGNVDLNKLNNFASVALHDQAVVGKSVIESFYSEKPSYSYFTGCSQGGRMGLALAQRYPGDYDGIAAAAPGLRIHEVGAYLLWPQQVMNDLGEYPYPCELHAIDEAAVAACDELDGVKDGIISLTEDCVKTFDPFSVVGNEIPCPQAGNRTIQISETAAKVVNETWTGMPILRGRGLLGGVRPGSVLSESSMTLATTECDESGCVGVPNFLGVDFVQNLLAKDPDVDVSSLSREEWDEYVYETQYYESMLSTTDPDLTPFREAGGKIISMHGTADELLSPTSTEDYHRAVDEVTGNVQDFFRYFEVPGLGHCAGRKSGQPNQLMQQLMDWVEKGTAPDSSQVKVSVSGTEIHDRIICPFPKRPQFDDSCGNPAKEKCWSCQESEK